MIFYFEFNVPIAHASFSNICHQRCVFVVAFERIGSLVTRKSNSKQKHCLFIRRKMRWHEC